eukprot:Awhi_evm1s7952
MFMYFEITDSLNQPSINYNSSNNKISPSTSTSTSPSSQNYKYYHLRITVRDTGEGIRPEHLETIFLPFRQCRKSDHIVLGGSGLGLFFVQNIVESDHGGHLKVNSTVGQGTEFIIDLCLLGAEESSMLREYTARRASVTCSTTTTTTTTTTRTTPRAMTRNKRKSLETNNGHTSAKK